jgi:predicted secreted protein
LYPAGDGSGNAYYQGDAIVTSITRSASFDGAVEYSIAFDGTGDLVYQSN